MFNVETKAGLLPPGYNVLTAVETKVLPGTGVLKIGDLITSKDNKKIVTGIITSKAFNKEGSSIITGSSSIGTGKCNNSRNRETVSKGISIAATSSSNHNVSKEVLTAGRISSSRGSNPK